MTGKRHQTWHIAGLCAGILGLTGACSDLNELPLIFGQSHIVGLNIAASATTDQPIDLTLGLKDRDFALVPIDPPAQADREIGATVANGQQTDSGTSIDRDALSTFGQFELDAKAKAAAAEVGLGKFFATGMAARILAEGFRCGVSKGTQANCVGRSSWPEDKTPDQGDADPNNPN